MHKEGIRDRHWNIIQKNQRNIKTKHGKTREIHIKDSIRQGGVLSVLEYGVLMDEINQDLEKKPLGIEIDDKGTRAPCLLWVDDVILIATSNEELQEMLIATSNEELQEMQWRNPHLPETPGPACEQTNISHRPHNFHTRTCPEKCLGGAAGYPWQWPLSHTDFEPTISGRDTTKLWSFPLGFFQGQLGTVSWCVLGKRLWGHTRGSRSLALLCRAHNQGRKWLHPKGNHHPQEIKPLVWWRMPGSPEG